MSRYEAALELPDGVDPFGGTARISTRDGVHHADQDEASFPGVEIEAIDVHDSTSVTLWASSREDVAALREHLTAALDDLESAVDAYAEAAPQQRSTS
jgi:hypothetical protein